MLVTAEVTLASRATLRGNMRGNTNKHRSVVNIREHKLCASLTAIVSDPHDESPRSLTSHYSNKQVAFKAHPLRTTLMGMLT